MTSALTGSGARITSTDRRPSSALPESESFGQPASLLSKTGALPHDTRMSIKTDLIRHYRWLRRYGLNDSHSGNASVREGDTVWVTPTGAGADTLTEPDLVAAKLGQPPPEDASLDARLHLAVYTKNRKVWAVLHSHGPYTVALTLDGQDFCPIDFEGQYHFGPVPVLAIPFEHHQSESPARVAETLSRHRVCVVRGHGVYAAGRSLNLAYKWSCSLELSAKTAYIARTVGMTGRG